MSDDEVLAALSSRRGVVTRALTSRLAEVKELAALWRAPTASPERVYLASLRHLRDGCHEWVAVDVLAALAHCDGSAVDAVEATGHIGADVDTNANADAAKGAGTSASAHRQLPRLRLIGGLPVWAFPHSTSLRWCRYLSPVLEGLLCSAYEDYVLAALSATARALDALRPLFAFAGDRTACAPGDLVAPVPLLVADGDEPELLRRRRQQQLLAHAAALGAVEAARLVRPLVAALSTAAAAAAAGEAVQTQRAALRLARRLQAMLASVAPLVGRAGQFPATRQ